MHALQEAEEEGRVAAMADLVTPAEVEANNTILVLIRHGLRAAEIMPLLDRIETLVRLRAALAASAVLAAAPAQAQEAVQAACVACGYSGTALFLAFCGGTCLGFLGIALMKMGAD